jgi:hypothetical protein
LVGGGGGGIVIGVGGDVAGRGDVVVLCVATLVVTSKVAGNWLVVGGTGVVAGGLGRRRFLLLGDGDGGEGRIGLNWGGFFDILNGVIGLILAV